MTTPKGMSWIDVTYLSERIDYEQGDGVFRGEACMRLLVAEDAARWLLLGKGEPILSEQYMYELECVLRAREHLCHGVYVEGSAAVAPATDEEA